ncbi:MAG: type II toxin-antitoxin system Phd/YefM family antitoxin [Methyloceanibacter sp.]
MAKKVSLRDANQKFARIVREVEERREPVIVTRRGEPVVEIVPAREGRRKLTPEQQRALDEMFELAHSKKLYSRGRKLSRDQLHER